MRKYLLVSLCGLFVVVVSGCGKDKSKETPPGAAGQPEEMADSTRLDSARTIDSYDSTG
ncbi:MAG: hypothetical protein NTW07_05495 [candidate division Zixibacteria bacterium]|nr:hypothetical protein [candidate division Zixibacteria bacterium]